MTANPNQALVPLKQTDVEPGPTHRRREAARRGAETRRTNRFLAQSKYGQLLAALREAQAASDRAKSRAANGCRRYEYHNGSPCAGANYYRSRRAQDADYAEKESAIRRAINLAPDAGVAFGWRYHAGHIPWVAYFELPAGQVSFHCPVRGSGPNYSGDWDGVTGASRERIVSAIKVLVETGRVPITSAPNDGKGGRTGSSRPHRDAKEIVAATTQPSEREERNETMQSIARMKGKRPMSSKPVDGVKTTTKPSGSFIRWPLGASAWPRLPRAVDCWLEINGSRHYYNPLTHRIARVCGAAMGRQEEKRAVASGWMQGWDLHGNGCRGKYARYDLIVLRPLTEHEREYMRLHAALRRANAEYRAKFPLAQRRACRWSRATSNGHWRVAWDKLPALGLLRRTHHNGPRGSLFSESPNGPKLADVLEALGCGNQQELRNAFDISADWR